MAWDNTVITNKGLEMLRQAIDGEELTIVSASGSDEIYPAASLMVQTAPANEKQTFNITEIKNMDNGIRVRVTITNDGLTKGYIMKQMCLRARLSESEEPQIIAISQDEVGTAIPADGEIASYLMQFYVLLKVDTATNMKIIVENSAFVTLDVVEELLKNKADLVNGKLPSEQLTIDNKPTEGSNNPISSGGAKAVLDKKQNTEDAFSGKYGDLQNIPESFKPSEHTHSCSAINQDSTHRFVSDTEKSKWSGKADEKTFKFTIPSGSWSTSGNVKYKQVSASGLLASDNPVAGIAYGSDASANEQYTEAFGCIEHITTFNGYIRAYTAKDGDVPKVNIPIMIKVVR